MFVLVTIFLLSLSFTELKLTMDDITTPVIKEEYYWKNGKVKLYISDVIKDDYLKALLSAIDFWEYWTCITFDITYTKPNTRINYISFQISDKLVTNGLIKPMSCNCERIISINNNNSKESHFKFYIGLHLGLVHYVHARIKDKEGYRFGDLRSISYAYKCNATCIFVPTCTNGGYVSPSGNEGCHKCKCPEGKICQQNESVKANPYNEMIKSKTDYSKDAKKSKKKNQIPLKEL